MNVITENCVEGNDWLAIAREDQKRAEELRREIADLDRQRAGLHRELAALEGKRLEALDILGGQIQKPKSCHGFTAGKRTRPIQTRSSVWWSAKVLFIHGTPLHVDELCQQIQKESGANSAPKKSTLVSNLSRYVRFGDTFSRPAPNVFGLIDPNYDVEAAIYVRAESGS